LLAPLCSVGCFVVFAATVFRSLWRGTGTALGATVPPGVFSSVVACDEGNSGFCVLDAFNAINVAISTSAAALAATYIHRRYAVRVEGTIWFCRKAARTAASTFAGASSVEAFANNRRPPVRTRSSSSRAAQSAQEAECSKPFSRRFASIKTSFDRSPAITSKSLQFMRNTSTVSPLVERNFAPAPPAVARAITHALDEASTAPCLQRILRCLPLRYSSSHAVRKAR